MRPIARASRKRFLTAGILLLIIPIMLSGCIVCVQDPYCNTPPPRAATLHVYALDYYTGRPIPWAEVELYVWDRWNWDYCGVWPVNPAGYNVIYGGYLYYDGYGGGEERDFRVVVYARGYCSEHYDIQLSYYYPSETLTFYLAPWAARDAGDTDPGPRREAGGLEPEDTSETERPAGKVVVGSEDQAEGE